MEQEQETTWQDIGAELRQARERSGQSLPDISHELRIPEKTLRNLESNNYSSFPSPAYAKSFLQQYSEFLGVDAHAWLANFDTGSVLSDVDQYEYLHPDPDDQARIHTRSQAPQSRGHRHHHRKTGGGFLLPLSLFLTSAALIAGIIYVGYFIDQQMSGETGPDSPPNPAAPGETVAPTSPTPSSPATNTPTPASPPLPDREPAIVIPENKPIPRAIIVPEDDEDGAELQIEDN